MLFGWAVAASSIDLGFQDRTELDREIIQQDQAMRASRDPTRHNSRPNISLSPNSHQSRFRYKPVRLHPKSEFSFPTSNLMVRANFGSTLGGKTSTSAFEARITQISVSASSVMSEL
jgi:hypothetical protein